MLRKKFVLTSGSVAAVALAAFIAVTLTAAPEVAAAPSYATVQTSSVTNINDNTADAGSITVLKVTTNGTIPQRADSYISSVLVFGYAWLAKNPDGSTLSFTVAVIHPSFRDAIHNPTGWHIHTGTLYTNTADCGGVANNVGSLAIDTILDPGGSVSITGNTLSASLITDLSNVTPGNYISGSATAFQLVQGTHGALCVAAA